MAVWIHEGRVSRPSEDLEQQLAEANRRLEVATAALAPKHKGGEVEAFCAAHAEVLHLERALAKSRNEPYAVPCDFPVKWDVGADRKSTRLNSSHIPLSRM